MSYNNALVFFWDISMADFSKLERLKDSEVLEQHEFPLSEFTGLFQKCHSAQEKFSYCVVVVDKKETGDTSDEELLKRVLASGYVDEASEITFRSTPASSLFYTYFNFQADGDAAWC